MNARLARISLPPRTVVGHRKDGTPIYPIAGGSVDAGVETGSGTDGGTDDGGSGEPDAGSTIDSSSTTVNKDEHDKVLSRMQAADRAKGEAEKRANDLERRLREYEDKDKTELEKAQRDAQEAQKRADEAEAGLKRERITNAFLLHNTVQWHNPERALALLDLSEVTIDDNGSVVGMDKAIEALTKSDPYLIKEEAADDGKTPPPPSGTPTGSGRKTDKQVDRDRLLQKYPALKR